jgi:hypothetical protein
MKVHSDRRRTGASPRSTPPNCTCAHSQRTTNSPATHCSRNRLVVITRAFSPVLGSRSAETAVRVDSCTTAAEGVCAVFMPCSVPASAHLLNIQKPENRI